MARKRLKTYDDPTEILGPAEGRYFPTGHKRFRWEVTEFNVAEDRLDGLIHIHHIPPPRSGDATPTVHLGSMEYAALASMLAEYALAYLMKLKRKQISESWVKRLRMKIAENVEFAGSIEIPFDCTLLGTVLTREAMNIDLSTLDIRIGGATIRMELDRWASVYHKVRPGKQWPLNIPAMHNYGYRLRDSRIEGIAVDVEDRSCSATVTLEDRYVSPAGGTGLAAARAQLMPTDILCITGQLMQVILHTAGGTRREGFPNIWLREADMYFKRPLWVTPEPVTVRFTGEDTVQRGGIPWRCITLESRIATIQSTFRIAHRIPAP